MFQTEIIVFLQSRGGDLVDGLMMFVSLFGYPAFYIVALCVLIFAFDFRRGFVLLQLLLWTGALTEMLKHLAGLPRPYDADARVLDVARDRAVRTELLAMGGHGFFDLPQDEAIRFIRSLDNPKFGLPSGHTSGFLVFAAGLTLLWDSRRGAVAACLAALLMAFSRLYLGRHFLADVLGGLVLGAAVLAVAAVWLRRPGASGRLPAATRLSVSPTVALALLVPPIALLLLPVPADAVGLLFGINVGFLLVGRRGYPVDAAAGWKRAARAILAIALVAGAGALARMIGTRAGTAGDLPIVAFALGILPGFALMWGTTLVALRTGLYEARR